MAHGAVSPSRVFKAKAFARAAMRAKIVDAELCVAIVEVMAGQADDLGGGVYKKRLGKNLYRSIVLAPSGENWVYQYLFAKQDWANDSAAELTEIREVAKRYALLSKADVDALVRVGDWEEICDGGRKEMQIKRIRQKNKVSQPEFARYLNTSESTVEKWESGAKRPSGMALKLLSIVDKHGLKMLA